MSILREEVRRNDLEFLNRILRDVVGAGASGILIVEAIGRVVSVGEERIASRVAAECQQSESGIIGHARSQQHE